MTLEEADKIVQIFGIADGGCPYCADAQARLFVEAFPEFAVIEDASRSDGVTCGLRATPAVPN